jgi:hypothetical protein
LRHLGSKDFEKFHHFLRRVDTRLIIRPKVRFILNRNGVKRHSILGRFINEVYDHVCPTTIVVREKCSSVFDGTVALKGGRWGNGGRKYFRAACDCTLLVRPAVILPKK